MELLLNLLDRCVSCGPALGEEACHYLKAKVFNKIVVLGPLLFRERLRMGQDDSWLSNTQAYSTRWECCMSDGGKHGRTLLMGSTSKIASHFALCAAGAWSHPSLGIHVIHTCRPNLTGSKVKVHFIDVNIWFKSVSSAWGRVRDNCLETSIINLTNKWISLLRPQPENVVQNSLLEWQSSWVHTVDPANLNNQFHGVLSDFHILVLHPLAGELGELLIVFTQKHLKWLVGKVFGTFDELCSFDKQSQSSNNSFFTVLSITNYICNDLADCVATL